MPAVLADVAFPDADFGAGDAKRGPDLLLGQAGRLFPEPAEPAQEQEEQPLFKTIAGFPDQGEGAAQGDAIVMIASGGHLNLRVRGGDVARRLSPQSAETHRAKQAGRGAVERAEQVQAWADERRLKEANF